jgi:hypothetical protein
VGPGGRLAAWRRRGAQSRLHPAAVIGWELGFQTTGFVFQVIGLLVAAVGVGKAWLDHAGPDDRLLARIVGPPLRWFWVKMLRRRPRPRPVQVDFADEVGLTDAVSLVGIRALDPAATIEDQLRQVKGEVDQAWTKANDANAAAERVQKAVDRLAVCIDQLDAAVQTAIRDRARTETVDASRMPWSAWP